jgi:DNA-binding CsgD family transcriptional regulator
MAEHQQHEVFLVPTEKTRNRFKEVPQVSVEQIIDDLYAGTLDRSAWDRAMLGMADQIGSVGVLLFAVDPSTQIVLRDETYLMDPSAMQIYGQHWVAQDIRLSAAMSVPVGEPMFESKLDLNQSWKNSAILNDFLLPNDLPHSLGTWLHMAPDKIVSLSFQGSGRRGPFDDADARQIRTLVPHLRRALEIRDRLEAHQIRAETLSSAFEGLQFGLLVLDKRGCILDVNGLAQDLLRNEPAIRRERDHSLWLREPAGAQLRDLVRSKRPSNNNTNGIFHVPRGVGRQSLSVLVSPMPLVPSCWIGAEPRWLVFVFDPELRIAPAVEIVARDLGISEREAAVASLLAIGFDLSQISQRLGIRVHTTRSHLKHIFEKTGVRSQGDLIRRILASPASFAAIRK